MKYYINEYDELVIHNDSGNEIFGINKDNNWIKSDFDHKGREIYYEDDTGFINK